jgi:hypothetical protein
MLDMSQNYWPSMPERMTPSALELRPECTTLNATVDAFLKEVVTLPGFDDLRAKYGRDPTEDFIDFVDVSMYEDDKPLDKAYWKASKFPPHLGNFALAELSIVGRYKTAVNAFQKDHLRTVNFRKGFFPVDAPPHLHIELEVATVLEEDYSVPTAHLAEDSHKEFPEPVYRLFLFDEAPPTLVHESVVSGIADYPSRSGMQKYQKEFGSYPPVYRFDATDMVHFYDWFLKAGKVEKQNVEKIIAAQ